MGRKIMFGHLKGIKNCFYPNFDPETFDIRGTQIEIKPNPLKEGEEEQEDITQRFAFDRNSNPNNIKYLFF